MKKLLIALTLCFISNIHADALSDAIRSTDMEAVKIILEQKSYAATKAFVKYLDVADEMIRLRRDQVISQGFNPKHFNDPKERSCNRQIAGSLAVLLASCAGTFGVIAYHDSIDSTDPMPSFFKSHENKIFFSALGAVTISFLSLFGGLLHSEALSTRYIRKLHSDATTIKELLYDHLATFE